MAKRAKGELALSESLQDQFQSAINRDRATTKGAGGWPFVKTSGAVMTIDNQPVGDPFNVICVAAIRQNSYFDGEYDPNTPATPTCYALDIEGNEATMAPPADLKTKQHDNCQTCPLNAFSSGRGRGKACKNTVKVAVFPPDRKDYSEGEGAILSLPPTSLKPWGEYARGLNERLGRPVFAVVTSFEKQAGEGGGFKLLPKAKDVINDEEKLTDLFKRANTDVWQVLCTPPPATGEEGRTKTRRTRKKVSKKRRATKRTRTRSRA